MNVTRCFTCLLLFLLCACKEKPKENIPAPQTVQRDTVNARGDENVFANSEEELQLTISPNPAHDEFYLELNALQDGMRYFIISSAGEIAQYGDVKSLKDNIEIPKLKDGIYT